MATVTFTDTRLGPGKLKLGTDDYAVQIAECKITSETSASEPIKTLGRPNPAVEITTTFTLEGAALFDFENPTGFVRYCWDNAGTEVAFEFDPKTGGDAIKGNCKIVETDLGGEVGEQFTVAFAFPCIAKPTIGAPTPASPAPTKTR